jgi:O-acetylserine/cysteine efflux transporter
MKPVDIFLALLVPVIWGMGFTLAKVAFVFAGFPPILLIACRFALTALVLVPFVRIPRGYLWQIFVIAFVSASIQYALTFTGLERIDASLAIIVVQLEFPFMALLAALLLGDRMFARGLGGLVLAFGGIVLIAGQPGEGSDLVGILMCAGGALTWAAGQILIKRLDGAVGGFTLIAWVALMATPQLFLLSAVFETGQREALVTMNWIGWAVVVYLGLVMTALAYGVWYHLLGRYPVTKVGPFLLLLPVASIAGSILILGETLSEVEAIGAIVVIAGVWLVTTDRPTRRQPAKG